MRFAEFFAGGGMVSEALRGSWTCAYANDICAKKAQSYFANHGHDAPLAVKSIENVAGIDVPDVEMMWGSFPCQDLSLAGNQAGLSGHRSGMVFEFFRILDEMRELGKNPTLLALENVTGLQRSNGGADLELILTEIEMRGYRVGWLVLDAVDFVPQSRPRLFIIGVNAEVQLPPSVGSVCEDGRIDLHLPKPNHSIQNVSDLIEAEPRDVRWNEKAKTEALLGMMSKTNLQKVHAALEKEGTQVGFVYKRTRIEHGRRVQRAEIRFDGVAGCLRTPGGGSSRQVVVIVEGGAVRSRLLSSREAARLMGLPDCYALPSNYNQAYHLIGDGVVVPVVRYLSRRVFEPIIESQIHKAA